MLEAHTRLGVLPIDRIVQIQHERNPETSVPNGPQQKQQDLRGGDINQIVSPFLQQPLPGVPCGNDRTHTDTADTQGLKDPCKSLRDSVYWCIGGEKSNTVAVEA